MNTKLKRLADGVVGPAEVQDILNELIGIAQRADHIKVANKSGGDFTKGTLVALSGYDATLAAPTVVKADANTGPVAAQLVLSEAIANDAAGIAYSAGVVTGLVADQAVGTKVYLSETPGAFAFAAPSDPGDLVQVVGYVTVRHASAGAILFYMSAAGGGGATEGAYVKPATGIPSTDMTSEVQASLVLADLAVVAEDAGVIMLHKTFTLIGVDPTPIGLGDDTAAQIIGTDVGATKNMGNGKTLIVDPDGAGDDTVTFVATAGTSTSDASPSTDITGLANASFMIAVNGGAASQVDLTTAGANTGNLIATEMQTKIQALGGAFAAVTVAYSGGKYIITNVGRLGTSSTVVVTDAVSNNAADDLKIGTANNGVEAAGTGDFANAAAATAAEIAAAIAARATGWSAEVVGNAVMIQSDSEGAGSSLEVNAASTADTVLGITGAAYGVQGFGSALAMLDTDYFVALTLNGTAVVDLGAKGLSVDNKGTTSFEIHCETAAAGDDIDVMVIGAAGPV